MIFRPESGPRPAQSGVASRRNDFGIIRPQQARRHTAPRTPGPGQFRQAPWREALTSSPRDMPRSALQRHIAGGKDVRMAGIRTRDRPSAVQGPTPLIAVIALIASCPSSATEALQIELACKHPPRQPAARSPPWRATSPRTAWCPRRQNREAPAGLISPAASSSFRHSALALALETIWERIISARAAKPGGLRLKGTGPATLIGMRQSRVASRERPEAFPRNIIGTVESAACSWFLPLCACPGDEAFKK